MNRELKRDLFLLLLIIVLSTSSLLNACTTSDLRRHVLALETNQTQILSIINKHNQLDQKHGDILQTIIDTISHVHNGGKKIVGPTNETKN